MASTNHFAALGSSSPAGGDQVKLIGNPDPIEVEIENLGFLALNGNRKVKVLPEAFPKDALPSPSASLFTVANHSGRYAAAGPSSFVLGTTALLRDAFTKNDEYTPELVLPLPSAVSHIVFNAAESHIILAFNNGGIRVYSIENLSAGTDADFDINTGDQSGLREVKPNPRIPGLVTLVTMGGNVLMLDLNTKSFTIGPDGQNILRSSVGTVAWSKLGKQIVCGMSDGTGWQMTPNGEGKASLPAPPDLENHYVSSIVWLENHIFITTHTPVPGGDPEGEKESVFHTLERKGTEFQFKRLPDPAPPFGMENRSPPYFFTAQLRKYAPALADLVVYSGICSTDIGVVARFSEPNKEGPANEFMVAQFANDTRRAEVPLSADSTDTSVIGMALDLSAKDNVRRPVGGDEIEWSPGPLPILMLLNFEGYIAAWNIIYDDAIKNNEKYTGMIIYETEQNPQQSQPQQTIAAPQTTAFGQSSFGSRPAANAFAPATAGFGQATFGSTSFGASPTPAFSTPSTPSKSAFGAPSVFGSKSSAWGSPAPSSETSAPLAAPAFGAPSQLGSASALAFGKPAFGTPSQLGATPTPAFGQPSNLGASAAPAFGQPTFGGTSAFGSSATPAASSAVGSSSGFAAFANKGGFAAAAPASDMSQGESVFGSGKALTSTSTDSAFGGANASAPAFGTGGFKIGSSFQADPKQSEDDKPDVGGSLGGFGSSLGNALGDGGGPTPAFGAPSVLGASSGFGSITSNTTSVFGGQAVGTNSAFGSAQSPFGGAPKNSTFGGVPSGSPFGTPTPTASPFGAPTSTASPFGTPAKGPSQFGAPTTTASPFGAPAPPSPFSGFSASKSAGDFGPNPFASSSTPTSVFGAPSNAPASSPFGAPATKQVETSVLSPPEEAPLPPDFAEEAPLPPDFSAESSYPVDVTATPLPPDTTSRPSFTGGSTSTEASANLPNSADSSRAGSPVEEEEAQLPPDFTAPQKQDMAVITALPDDDDAEYSQEEAEGGSQDEYDEEDNYEGEEDGEEEEEYSEEEEGDNDKENRENKTPIKSLGPLTLTPSSSKTAGGSVFGSTPSYANALASGVIPSSSPFSNLKPNQDELESDEEFSGDDDGEYDEEEEDEEEVVRPPRQLKSKQMTGAKSTMSHRAPKSIFPSSKKSSPFSHKKDEKKPVVFNLQATEKAGDKKEDSKPVFFDFRPTEKSDDKENKFLLFETKPTEKPEEKPVFGTSSSIISGPSKETPPSLFGGSTKETSNVFGGAKKEAPSLFDNATKETSIVSDKGKAVEKAPESSLFGSAAPKPSGGGVFGSAFGGPPATIDSSPFEKKETSQLPIKPTPKPESPKRAAEPTPPVEEVVEEEESDVESEVDFDADYSDNEDEKIREQLFHGPVKPSQNLPEIKKLKEVEVPEKFEEVFDSIYLSGNIMVNKLGQMVRGLQSYHLAQQTPVEGVKHESPEDMKDTDDWRLCEMGLISKTIDNLLRDVKKINQEKPELEEKRLAATKGFIKLDTKESEIERLFSVHSDPAAAAEARSRLLAPEQQLQQRQLRKSFMRVEKALNETESKATALKALIAQRDRFKLKPKIRPPTADATRVVVLKLTGMAEKKNREVEHLEERLRRLKLGHSNRMSRSVSGTPGRYGSPSRFDTPERSILETPARRIGGVNGSFIASTPVMLLVEDGDVSEIAEENRRRREAGKKLKGALQKRGGRFTVGETVG